jgi:hypothetical protein
VKLRRFAIVPIIAFLLVAGLLCGAAVLTTGCGNLRDDNIRKGALVAGETALSINQDELDLYAAEPHTIYTPDMHAKAGAAIKVVLITVRAYERAAAAWPEHVTMPADVPQALLDAIKAIGTVEGIVQGIPGNGKLLANLDKLKNKIGGD